MVTWRYLRLDWWEKGFTQKKGINFKETFSPVSTKDSFRIIIALPAHFNLELHQMNVKTTFLNGDLSETIYMQQPKDFCINSCRNLPFGGKATRGSRVHLPREEGAQSRHQRLFEENVRKIRKVWSTNFKFERFGSCFYARGRY